MEGLNISTCRKMPGRNERQKSGDHVVVFSATKQTFLTVFTFNSTINSPHSKVTYG